LVDGDSIHGQPSARVVVDRARNGADSRGCRLVRASINPITYGLVSTRETRLAVGEAVSWAMARAWPSGVVSEGIGGLRRASRLPTDGAPGPGAGDDRASEAGEEAGDSASEAAAATTAATAAVAAADASRARAMVARMATTWALAGVLPQSMHPQADEQNDSAW